MHKNIQNVQIWQIYTPKIKVYYIVKMSPKGLIVINLKYILWIVKIIEKTNRIPIFKYFAFFYG